MKDVDAKLSELKEVGKIKKFAVYEDIMHLLFNERDQGIYQYFEKSYQLWKEYLEFDNNPDPEIKIHFSEIINTVFSFIKNTNDINRFNKYFSIFKEIESFIGDLSVKAEIYNSLGFIFISKHDFRMALKYLKLSLELANKTENLLLLPNRYTDLGFLYETKGDNKQAEKYYLLALEFANRNNYQKAMHLALASLGRLKINLEDYPIAIEYFIRALDLIEHNKMSGYFIATVANLAACFMYMNNPEKSLYYYNMIPLDFLKEKMPMHYYEVLVNIALNEIELEKKEAGEEKLKEALRYAKENDNNSLLLISLDNLGELYSETERFSEAIEMFTKAIDIAENKGNEKQLSNSYDNIANAYKNNNQIEKAIYYFNKAYDLSKKLGYKKKAIMILKDLSECYYKINDHKKAYSLLNKYVDQYQKYDELTKKQQRKRKKELAYDAGKSKQYKFTSGISLISREMSKKIGNQIVGNSPVMNDLIQQVYLASRSSEASILLLGESGTGKDLFAKLVHYASIRHKGPFVAVNSAVFSAGLVQSALFGHRKGAFTGASYEHIGYFEQANKGTIFLDEISEMSPDIQAHLLRILETKVINRMGDNVSRKLDFRLISASNKDIYSLIEQNKFRFDLLNRINTIEILIPPLRKRKEDIPLLIEYFLNVISLKLQKKQPIISQSALNILCDYDYPGNVRELKNIVERLILFNKNSKIVKEDLYFLNLNQSKETLEHKFLSLNLAENEKKLIKEALKRTNNVQVKAAKLLGISHYSLNRRLKKLDLT